MRQSRTHLPTHETHAYLACQGEQHLITIDTRGNIRLHGHPQLRAEQALIAMGAEEPACLVFLGRWAYWIATQYQSISHGDVVPVGFVSIWEDAYRCKLIRANIQEAIKTAMDWRLQRWWTIVRAVHRLFVHDCRYWHMPVVDLQLVPRECDSTHSVDISTYAGDTTYNAQIDISQQRVSVFLTLRLSWWVLYRQGLAVVDGHFVLERFYRHKNLFPIYRVAKKTTNGELKASLARISVIKGTPHLEWI